MSRTDYFDDPAAPPANSLVVSVVVVVVNRGCVLMIQRADNGRWSLPGGGQELGESVRQAGIRETREETGIEVEILGVVGIYSNPRHIIAYDNGEVRQEFAICLSARYAGGAMRASEESRAVNWISKDDLMGIDASASTLLRIRHYFDRDSPFID